MAAALTITFDDPDTIKLLLQYRAFIESEDDVQGTIREMAEGLIVGCLDDHSRFQSWSKAHNERLATEHAARLKDAKASTTNSQPAPPDNVTAFPGAKAANRIAAPLKAAHG